MKKSHLLSALLLAASYLTASVSAAPEPLLLWPNGAPGSGGRTSDDVVTTSPGGSQVVTQVNKPSITVYLPPKETATGAAVIIAPGGGHKTLNITPEGTELSAWFNDHGIAAFVLRYRLAEEPGSPYTVDDHAVADMHRAIRLVRSRAAEWNVKPDKLGVIGFSAGGEVCSIASMRFDAGQPDAADPLDRLSDRPDFQALIYPGRTARIVPFKDSPPAFLLASANDRTDIAEGLTKVYLDFKHAGVPVELHLYADSGHGFGYRKGMHGPVSTWVDRLEDWLIDRKFTTAVTQ